MKDKIIKDICTELNISISPVDLLSLHNIFFKTLNEFFSDYYSHAQLHYLGDRNGWNNFVLPIDCIYILKVKPRVAYKVDRNKLLTPGSDKVYIEYISENNDRLPRFKEVMKERIKEFYKIPEETS